MLGEEEKNQKKYPFEIDEYYSVGLNSLKRIYTQHPRFNGNVRLIYELLLDYWNPKWGYAFPDQWELAMESGLSRKSVINQLKRLEELDLIEIVRSPIGRNNNVYYLKKPVTTMEELYEKFPNIKEESEKRLRSIQAEKQKSIKRWDEDEK